jgi:DMSO/TMAO reductase YedYZ molybdopterin-dependent catalytic subunit
MPKFKVNLINTAIVFLMVTALAVACAPSLPGQGTSIPIQPAERQPLASASAPASAAETQPMPGQAGAVQQQETTDEQMVKLQSLIRSDPTNVDSTKLPITPVEKLHTTGNPPEIDIATYRLSVEGRVDHPLSFSYEELKSLPAVEETVVLICPDFFVDNARWTGIPVSALLESAGVQPGANKVTFVGVDGYRQILTLDDARAQGVFLAYAVNGQILPAAQGFPLRLVVPKMYGNIWAKWVQRIEIG